MDRDRRGRHAARTRVPFARRTRPGAPLGRAGPPSTSFERYLGGRLPSPTGSSRGDGARPSRASRRRSPFGCSSPSTCPTTSGVRRRRDLPASAIPSSALSPPAIGTSRRSSSSGPFPRTPRLDRELGRGRRLGGAPVRYVGRRARGLPLGSTRARAVGGARGPGGTSRGDRRVARRGAGARYKPERAFTPHLTVARFDPVDVGSDLPEAATRAFDVDRLVLYRTTSGGRLPSTSRWRYSRWVAAPRWSLPPPRSRLVLAIERTFR